jgi:hypothetical protein
LGQEVYNKQSEFQDGKQMVELSEGIAQGAYIVRVKQENSVITKRIVLSK